MPTRGQTLRIKITLEPAGKLNLAIHHNASIQGLIYSLLDRTLADWLHNEAYQFGKRRYPMFTFSRLAGVYQLDKKTKRISFDGPVSFKLASYNTDILASLAENLLKAPQVRLGQYNCEVRGVEILKKPTPDFSKPIRVRALSPITIHQTATLADGRKKTIYPDPQQSDWSEMLLSNLCRKAKALNWEENTLKALENSYIRPLKVSSKDRKPLKYKDFWIIGWLGLYELKLLEPYFWLAYDTGLGARGSQGFGMVEVV